MNSPLLPTYARIDVAFEKGEGAWLYATNGKRYLDFGGGIAVACLGYSHPALVGALIEQGQKLWHTSNLFRIPQGEKLAQRLVDSTFADLVFFTNSGAEAVECAIKTARKYQYASGHPERYRIITFDGAFHGRTLATISAGGNPKYLEGFGPPVQGFDHVPFGDHKAVEAAIGPETAAIMIEPIQGEGGIRTVPPQCLRGLRELCDKHGILLIFDEVQCGMGRTGKFFAYEHSGVRPDIMTVAKGIGGGFPLGACLTTAEAGKGMTYGTHGTTYGGNPLATAVGNAVLDVMLVPGFLEDVQRKGSYARQRLAQLMDQNPDVITGVRGEGLMLGLRIDPKIANGDFATAAREAGLLVIPALDNVVRLLPPLIVSEDEIAEGVRRLEEACAAMRGKLKAAANAGAPA